MSGMTERLRLLDNYITLEKNVLDEMRYQCSPSCIKCNFTCCSDIICVNILKKNWTRSVALYSKGLDSPGELKQMIDERFRAEKEMPCPFNAGRPIICIEYFCDKIYYDIKTEFRRFFLYQLSNIIPFFLNLKISRKKIINIDLQDNTLDISQDDLFFLQRNIDIAWRKLNIIKKYLRAPEKNYPAKNFFNNIMYLEDKSSIKIIDTLKIV